MSNLVAICIYKPKCVNSEMVLRNLERLAKALPHVKFARANGELVLDADSALVSSTATWTDLSLYFSWNAACPVSPAISMGARLKP